MWQPGYGRRKFCAQYFFKRIRQFHKIFAFWLNTEKFFLRLFRGKILLGSRSLKNGSLSKLIQFFCKAFFKNFITISTTIGEMFCIDLIWSSWEFKKRRASWLWWRYQKFHSKSWIGIFLVLQNYRRFWQVNWKQTVYFRCEEWGKNTKYYNIRSEKVELLLTNLLKCSISF